MKSFTAVINALVEILSDNAGLQQYCQTEFKKPLQVKKVFRRRIEANTGDLPMIMITRPSVVKNLNNNARDGKHSVFLYILFNQQDREKAVTNLIEIEEMIDDIIYENYTLNNTATNAEPGESANDEGVNHPNYSLIMEYAVLHRRI